MNQRLLLFSFVLFPAFASAQTSKQVAKKPSLVSKPAIDTTAIFNWPYLYNDCNISPNGGYILYKIFNQPRDRNTLVVQRTGDTAWKKQVVDANAVCFSSDEKQAVYSNSDTLFFLSLSTGEAKPITGVRSSRQPRVEKGTWLAYQLKSDAKEVVLLNIVTGQEQRFTSVEDYSFSDNGKALLVKQNDQSSISLQWVNLETKKSTTIWTAQNGMQLTGYNFDLQGEQLVFMAKTAYGNTIWYYKQGMNTATEKVNAQSEGIATDLQISGDAPFFNKGGKYIFFKLQKPVAMPKPDPNAVQVDIWSYKDVQLVPVQPKTTIPEKYTSVIGIDANKVVQVEQQGEQILTSSSQSLQNINSDNLVIGKKKSQDFFWNWNKSQLYYIISVKDGSQKSFESGVIHEFLYSPSGKYIVYFDHAKMSFMCHEIKSGVTRNITQDIPERLDNEYKQHVPGRTFPLAVGIAGWFENDDAVLIYDNYDIWKVDPMVKCASVNFTNGYGKKHFVKLKLVYEKDEQNNEVVFYLKDTLLLSGFNALNKYNGYFKVSLNKTPVLQFLTMLPKLSYRKDSQISNNDGFDAYGGMQPMKALKANLWILKQQTDKEAPNYFLTTDFKNYKKLTDFKPQGNYNWLSAELVSYKQLDGTTSEGILYKPEGFDPNKKYPIIFTYYETFSFRMYEFATPALTRARMNIPWFVSRNYLVFTPDIHYSFASKYDKVAGEYAVNSIVGAANHFSKLSYVDGKKMGIQGHSFGGYETNYLVTHSNLFAAACEASGTSNVITGYLGLIMNSKHFYGDKQGSYETGQGRLGASLWENSKNYIKYSPVFKAHKISAPLLIMHNLNDGSIDFNQGIQMYMALRRLQKPVWMLQYDNEAHVILDNKNALDFTLRMNQFFDHYLKWYYAPKWMVGKAFEKYKGISNLYDFDSVSNCAKDCKVCRELNNKKN